MISITYMHAIILISIAWLTTRFLVNFIQKKINWKREWQLLLVYICIIVVVRFTFFPFSRINGDIQPLIYDSSKLFPLRINLVPFVYMFDYLTIGEMLLNFVGNTVMFIPLGIVWPSVFQELNTPFKTISMGAIFSLCIEVLQLPFFDRVSDIDDILLNTLGFIIGYGFYYIAKMIIIDRTKSTS